MNENIILPSMGWNIAFLCVCVLFVLLLSVSRKGNGDWKKFFQSKEVQIGERCVIIILLLADFIETAYLLHSYSSAENVGWNLIFYTVFAIIAGIVGASAVASVSDYTLSTDVLLNVSNICVAIIGICFLLTIHFWGILYCIGIGCVSLLLLLLEHLSDPKT